MVILKAFLPFSYIIFTKWSQPSRFPFCLVLSLFHEQQHAVSNKHDRFSQWQVLGKVTFEFPASCLHCKSSATWRTKFARIVTSELFGITFADHQCAVGKWYQTLRGHSILLMQLSTLRLAFALRLWRRPSIKHAARVKKMLLNDLMTCAMRTIA